MQHEEKKKCDLHSRNFQPGWKKTYPWLRFIEGKMYCEGDVRVCGDAVLRYIWCGFAVIFILSRGIAVSKHDAICG